MENFNKKELINELQRTKELMFGKEIINEQLSKVLQKVLLSSIKYYVDEIIKQGVKSVDNFQNKIMNKFDDIASKVRNAKGSDLTRVEENAIEIELKKTATVEAKKAVQASEKRAAQTATADLTKKAGQLVKTGGDDAGKTVKTVKTAGDDASKKVVTNTSSQSKGTLKNPPVLVKKGADVTDNAGNVIVKNGQVTDLTPAIVKSESGVPKLAPGLTDDAAKPYFRKYLNAFDEPTAKVATGATKKGSTLVGKMTEATKSLLIKSGILKNVGGKLTISWKRVLLYSLLFGVGYAVVANWFKDNGVTPVKDPSDPIVNQDPSIVDPTLSGSQDSGTSGGSNTVVSQSPSGQNRYTFDFAAVMAALNATGKCPTGYGTSGTDGTNQTSGSTDTNVITTEPDTTLSSDDYYEYISS